MALVIMDAIIKRLENISNLMTRNGLQMSFRNAASVARGGGIPGPPTSDFGLFGNRATGGLGFDVVLVSICKITMVVKKLHTYTRRREFLPLDSQLCRLAIKILLAANSVNYKTKNNWFSIGEVGERTNCYNPFSSAILGQ